MRVRTVVFDAYGTLFDVYAVTARLEQYCPGQGGLIAQVWRDKQIEYSRLVSLCDPSVDGSRYYEAFSSLTRKALSYALARFGATLSDAQFDTLMRQYDRLEAFAEVPDVLAGLKQQGLKTAIFSNGDEQMLAGAIAHANVGHLLDHVISVDQVRHFKTMPQAYALVQAHTGDTPKDCLFVSGNAWDILGAQWFGFQTCWINRAGLPTETLGPEPHHIGEDLRAVAEVLEIR